MSVQLARLAAKHPDKIDLAEVDDDGAWIYLRAGFRTMDDPMAALHTIHGETVAMALEIWRLGVVPCNCDGCKSAKEKK